MTLSGKMLLLIVLLLPVTGKASAWEEHPRLILHAQRLAEIRKAIMVQGSHHQQAFSVLEKKVQQNDFRLFRASEGNWNYARAYMAQAAAFLFQLTGDTTYAHIAYQTVSDIFSDPGPERRLPYSESYGDKVDRNYGLSRATVGLGLAYTYDWCYHAWTPAQRLFVKEKMQQALDSWQTYRHANLESRHQASNWVAVCRGGELILMLAAGEEKERKERFAFLKYSLSQHLQNAYSPAGFTQEGIAYCGYAGIFLLPALYALESTGDTALLEKAKEKAWWRWLMFAGTFIPNENGARHVMQTGVDGMAPANEGWASLLLHLVPSAELSQYLYFYDRHEGKLAKAPATQKYDALRAGMVWALLYYPETVKAKNPSGEAGFSALADTEAGMYYFRNRWQDEQDIIVSLMADKRHHSHAWDQAEAFQVQFAGLGTFFTQGPFKERQAYRYSTLLVDGQNSLHNKQNGHTGGTVQYLKGKNKAAAIVIDGGEKYKALRVEAQRHAFVSFPAPDVAMIALNDYMQADTAHAYTWNLHLGEEVKAEINEGVRTYTTFLLQGKNTAYVKGWVLPAWDSSLSGAEVNIVQPQAGVQALQVETQGKSGSIRVVLLLGRGIPPEAKVSTGKRKLRWQTGSRRIWWEKKNAGIHSTGF
jgi:hypothetical protein